MYKKILKTSAFVVPLVSLPVLVVTACDEQAEPRGDQMKAMQNIKILLHDFKNIFQA